MVSMTNLNGLENGNANLTPAKALDEARGQLLTADRLTRPTVMRWKPKLSAAGDAYCRAAIYFHQAGEVEASKNTLLKACECFKKKRSWYSAAKTLEQAMAIAHKQVQNLLN